MYRLIFSVVLAITLSACVTPGMEFHPENKPTYQKVSEEERRERQESCRLDPYQDMCQPGQLLNVDVPAEEITK